MVDLTSIALAVIAGVFTVISVAVPIVLIKYMEDKKAAQTLGTAIQNSLGAIQQAAQNSLTRPPAALIPGVARDIAPGVQYVMDHAGEEAVRLKLSPLDIADKISARIGLLNIDSNIATAAGPGTTSRPLDPVPPATPLSAMPLRKS